MALTEADVTWALDDEGLAHAIKRSGAEPVTLCGAITRPGNPTEELRRCAECQMRMARALG